MRDQSLISSCIYVEYMYVNWSFLHVCRFKVWTMKGHKKLLEFLADMG